MKLNLSATIKNVIQMLWEPIQGLLFAFAFGGWILNPLLLFLWDLTRALMGAREPLPSSLYIIAFIIGAATLIIGITPLMFKFIKEEVVVWNESPAVEEDFIFVENYEAYQWSENNES